MKLPIYVYKYIVLLFTFLIAVCEIGAAFPQVDIQLKEFFVDSTTVGKKGMNKLQLSRYSMADSNYVVIQFFSKRQNKWELRNEFDFSKDDIIACDTKIIDFNNDGLKDMTYISAVAARSANEVRRLFIYNRIYDSLIYIKNSEDYPNMQYNKTLNCIDAMLFHGSSTNVFLRLHNDELREFATINADNELVVSEYDKDGNETVIYRKKRNKAFYVRYKNYKPLTPYDQR